MRMPTVAIVGRPNVGKSSLFNRFLQRRLAVVHETPGVTRDRNYAVCDWNGIEFRLVDTGGVIPDADNLMDRLIYDQTEFAIAEADLVILLVDVKTGMDDTDRTMVRRLQKAKLPFLLVANKVDNDPDENDLYDFYRLGIGDPEPVSAATGRGVGDLLDKLVGAFPPLPEDEDYSEDAIRVAVVGRPNVGKSSLINKLVGKDRLIVSPVAGTTRDAVDTPLEFDGQKYLLVDTAGLRRKYKVQENIEFYTTLRTIKAVDSADVAVILIDAADGLTSQDQRILDEVLTARRAAILVVNKWDLIEKDSLTADRFTTKIRDQLGASSYLPVVYISALSGQRAVKVLTLVREAFNETNRRISTPELNKFLEKVIARKHPPARKGKYIKFNYVTQTEVAPPTFIFFVNHPKLVDKSYISYLGNQLRSTYGFVGVPIRLKFHQK